MHDDMQHEAEGRKTALGDLRGLVSKGMRNRVLSLIRKAPERPAESAPEAAAQGPSLMDRLKALRGK
jgi:hypothetical protein